MSSVQYEPLEPNRSIAVRIAEQIAAQIRSGEFELGERLPTETSLARQFGVSRPSVREALGALQFVGYIGSLRGSGRRVISFGPTIDYPDMPVQVTPQETIRLFEARLLLEPQVAALAARDPNIGKLEQAEELIEGMGLVVQEPGLNGETDLRVHRAISEICENSFLRGPALRLLDAVGSSSLRPLRNRAWADRELPPIWEGQHRDTVRAIRDGDSVAAASSTWDHLASSARNALTVVSEHPSVDERTIEEFASLLKDGPFGSRTTREVGWWGGREGRSRDAFLKD